LIKRYLIFTAEPAGEKIRSNQRSEDKRSKECKAWAIKEEEIPDKTREESPE
jgi:hypothetical protein